MGSFIREMREEARKAGLSDVTLYNRKKHAVLEGRAPDGRKVSVPVSRGHHGGGNPHAIDYVVTSLKRQLRH